MRQHEPVTMENVKKTYLSWIDRKLSEDNPFVSLRYVTLAHHDIMEASGFHNFPKGQTVYKDTMDEGFQIPHLSLIQGVRPLVQTLTNIIQELRKPTDGSLDLADIGVAMLAGQCTAIRQFGFPQLAAQAAEELGDTSDTILEDSKTAIAGRLVLMVTEIGEALEKLVQGDLLGFVAELADIQLRLCDLVGELAQMVEFQGLDFSKEVLRKLKFNMDRPLKHGKEA